MTQITKEAIEAAWAAYQKFGWSTQEGMEKALEAALPFLPIAGEGKELVDVLRQGIKDQGYGYTMKGNRLTVSTDEVFAVDLDKLASFVLSALISSPGKDGGKRIYEFDRYIKGQLMAEGVTVERASTLEEAFAAAARIASRGPSGEVPVLVMRPMATSIPLPGKDGGQEVRSTHEERIALAAAITWDVNNITPDEVRGIIERLAAEGFRLQRIGGQENEQ